MAMYSKKLKRADGIITVALFRCFKLFGKNYWYCRFMVDQGFEKSFAFYSYEHTNKFTAYRGALNRAKHKINPSP